MAQHGARLTSASPQLWSTAARWLLPVLAGMVVGVLTLGVFDLGPGHLSLNRGPAPWPLPGKAADRIRAASLPPYEEAKPLDHPHAHLDVFVDGSPVPVPAGLGLVPPYASLHTHSASGILHMEARDRDARYSLGDLFALWGVRLTPSCVGGYCAPETPTSLYVNGKRWDGPISGVNLEPYSEIALIIGRPPGLIPSVYDCHDAAPTEVASCQGFLAEPALAGQRQTQVP